MVSFPYQSDVLLGQAFPTAVAQVQVQDAQGAWVNLQFEFDSGAAISTLPASAAQHLGVNITSGIPLQLQGASGVPFTVYVHTIPIRFQGDSNVYQIQAAFATDDTVPLLLGRFSVWNQLATITLDNKNSTLTIGAPTSTFSPKSPYLLAGLGLLAVALIIAFRG